MYTIRPSSIHTTVYHLALSVDNQALWAPALDYHNGLAFGGVVELTLWQICASHSVSDSVDNKNILL